MMFRKWKKKIVKSLLKKTNVQEEINELKNTVGNLVYEMQDMNLKIPTIVTYEETFSAIINQRRSLARFGDGEFLILVGESIDFQEHDVNLEMKLKEVLSSCDNRLLIGIPNAFGTLEKRTNEVKQYWRNFMIQYRDMIYTFIDFEKEYHGAGFSRPSGGSLGNLEQFRKHFELMRSIWEDRKCVLLSSEILDKDSVYSNAKNLHQIKVPDKNAFSQYESLKEEVLKYNPQEYLVLLSIGPTATVLAYELMLKGYQAIDIGHANVDYKLLHEKINNLV